MKVLAVCLVFAVALAVASAALPCRGDKGECAEDECCTLFGRVSSCKNRPQIGEICEVYPERKLLKDPVYLVMCPCAEGLKCVPRIGGQMLGTCQEIRGEEE